MSTKKTHPDSQEAKDELVAEKAADTVETGEAGKPEEKSEKLKD